MLNTRNVEVRHRVVERKCHLAPAVLQHAGCLVLTNGMLLRQRMLPDGRRQIVGFHVRGDICGLSALHDNRTDAELVALTTTGYVPVDRLRLLSAARASSSLVEIMLRAMLREMALADAWTVNLGQRTAYERMAHFACELETRLRLAGIDTSEGVEWPGTQADLSGITGLSLVHVNRTIGKLNAGRLVSSGRCMTFRNFDRLREVAGFDPSYLSDRGENLGDTLLSCLGAAHEREHKPDFPALAGLSH